MSRSIEEAKQKAEYDKKLLLAEQKKTSVRETIESMRKEFQKLIARNDALPPHLALSRKVRYKHHLSCDDCLEEDYQNCSVLYCVPQ